MKGTAKEIIICNKKVRIGDYVKVQYTTDVQGIIQGEVVELWDENEPYLQARVSSGWCFHDHDKIIEHRSNEKR